MKTDTFTLRVQRLAVVETFVEIEATSRDHAVRMAELGDGDVVTEPQIDRYVSKPEVIS